LGEPSEQPHTRCRALVWHVPTARFPGSPCWGDSPTSCLSRLADPAQLVPRGEHDRGPGVPGRVRGPRDVRALRRVVCSRSALCPCVCSPTYASRTHASARPQVHPATPAQGCSAAVCHGPGAHPNPCPSPCACLTGYARGCGPYCGGLRCVRTRIARVSVTPPCVFGARPGCLAMRRSPSADVPPSPVPHATAMNALPPLSPSLSLPLLTRSAPVQVTEKQVVNKGKKQSKEFQQKELMEFALGLRH
jgi:hypothetical protein